MIDHSHLKNICGHPVIENIDKIKAIFAIRTDFMVAFLLLFDKFLSYSSLSICSIRLSKCVSINKPFGFLGDLQISVSNIFACS